MVAETKSGNHHGSTRGFDRYGHDQSQNSFTRVERSASPLEKKEDKISIGIHEILSNHSKPTVEVEVVPNSLEYNYKKD